MAESVPTISPDGLRGVATGVLFMAIFGTLWSTIGLGGLQGWGLPWLLIAALLVGGALVGGGLFLWRAAGRLAARHIQAENPEGRDPRRAFWLIFATEGIAIAVASIACNAAGRFDLFFPIMAIIVGLHFLPLARLFDVAFYYAVGALLCLLGVAALAVPLAGTLAGREVAPRSVFIGFGAAFVLWGTGLALWRQGSRALS